MKKKKYLYIIIAIVVLSIAGYFILFSGGSDEIKYRTEKVSRGDVVVQVRATGTINPVQTVQVGSQVSGIIEKIYVDFNSEVKKGQIIARIDSTFLYASVKEAEANLERNQAQVNEAKRNYDRTIELFKKNLVSQADLDAAQTAYEAAQAQYKQSQAALDRARVNLRYSVIRAPIDGVVISREVDVGQTVAASFQAPKLFTIANDLRQMQVEASVDEADIGQIQEGQIVTFTVDAYPGEEFEGTVTQVRLSPVINQNVVTYTVIIQVPNEDLKLRPGMTATVSILVNKRENVLRVPTLAVRFQPPEEILAKIKNENQNKTEERKDSVMERFTPEASIPEQKLAEFRERRRLSEQGNFNSSPDRKIFKRIKPKVSTIWVLDDRKNPKPLNVRTGLSDMRFTEVITNELKEGDEVIIGITNGLTASGTQQTNPFAPRMIGPPGSGMGRRGP